MRSHCPTALVSFPRNPNINRRSRDVKFGPYGLSMSSHRFDHRFRVVVSAHGHPSQAMENFVYLSNNHDLERGARYQQSHGVPACHPRDASWPFQSCWAHGIANCSGNWDYRFILAETTLTNVMPQEIWKGCCQVQDARFATWSNLKVVRQDELWQRSLLLTREAVLMTWILDSLIWLIWLITFDIWLIRIAFLTISYKGTISKTACQKWFHFCFCKTAMHSIHRVGLSMT